MRLIALSTALLATVLGTLCAIGLWRVTSRYSEMVRAFLLLPLIIPQIISAMAFYRLWIPLGLLDSYSGLILAHTILAAPMVLITVSASLANFDPKLEQASRNLGASNWTTMRRVILPSDQAGGLCRRAVCLHPQLGRDRRDAVHLEIQRLHPAAPDVERHPRKHRSHGGRRGGGADRHYPDCLCPFRPSWRVAAARADMTKETT